MIKLNRDSEMPNSAKEEPFELETSRFKKMLDDYISSENIMKEVIVLKCKELILPWDEYQMELLLLFKSPDTFGASSARLVPSLLFFSTYLRNNLIGHFISDYENLTLHLMLEPILEANHGVEVFTDDAEKLYWNRSSGAPHTKKRHSEVLGGTTYSRTINDLESVRLVQVRKADAVVSSTFGIFEVYREVEQVTSDCAIDSLIMKYANKTLKEILESEHGDLKDFYKASSSDKTSSRMEILARWVRERKISEDSFQAATSVKYTTYEAAMRLYNLDAQYFIGELERLIAALRDDPASDLVDGAR